CARSSSAAAMVAWRGGGIVAGGGMGADGGGAGVVKELETGGQGIEININSNHLIALLILHDDTFFHVDIGQSPLLSHFSTRVLSASGTGH
ncbi:hypothetical protein H5410_045831, partial [Solanum commersonii]